MEHWWNNTDKEKPESSAKKRHGSTLNTTNPTRCTSNFSTGWTSINFWRRTAPCSETFMSSEQVCIWCVLHAAVRRFYQGILYCHTVTRFRGTRVNIISFTPKSMALPAPNFMKVAKAKQHYVQIFSNEFHLNGAINVGSTDWNVFTHRSMAFHCTNFHETHKCSMTFLPDLHRISKKQVKEETNYRKTFNNVFEWRIAVALTAGELRIRNFCTNFQANPADRLLTDVW